MVFHGANRRPNCCRSVAIWKRWLKSRWSRSPYGCPRSFSARYDRTFSHHLPGWRKACEWIGLPALLFCDLRRSAVANMERAGVQDKVALEISGHGEESQRDKVVPALAWHRRNCSVCTRAKCRRSRVCLFRAGGARALRSTSARILAGC